MAMKPVYRKFRNHKTNGYHSKKEANRAAELRVLADRKIITEFKEQSEFTLIPKQDGERAVKYIADFSYIDCDGHIVVEDVKGFKTPDYIIKRKLMKYLLGITVVEI